MIKFTINDWLTIQTRKDLTFIRRSLERESVNYAIFADMFIAFFSFVMNHVLWTTVDPETGGIIQIAPSWYWIITAILLVAIPAGIFIKGALKKKRYQDDSKKVMPVDYLVDVFDNEICYDIMSADSMRDHMLDQTNNLEAEIRKFYFIEATYYTNRAATQLYYFMNQGEKAIQTEISRVGVSAVRFNNVCEIVSKIYNALISFARNNTEYIPLLKDSEDKIYNFNDLIMYMKEKVPELSDLQNFKVVFPWRREMK